MTKLSRTDLRADHCGSLIRPRKLRQARLDRHLGKITDAELEAIEDVCILEVLRMQNAVGLGITSDGEFRRQFWFSALFESVRGMKQSTAGRTAFSELQKKNLLSNPEFERPYPVVTGKIERDPTRRHIMVDEISFLKKHSKRPFKITVPSTHVLFRFMDGAFEQGVTDRYYPGMNEVLQDLRAYVEAEVALAAESGVAYIQIDNPEYGRLMSSEYRELLRSKGEDPDVRLTAEIASDNQLLRAAKRPDNVTGIHICLGTYIGDPNTAKNLRVNYEPSIVNRVFEELEADRFTCEYSVRSGTLASLKRKPKLGNKVIALGIVNVLQKEIESIDSICSQVKQAFEYVDPNNLAICNNCGFSGASVDAFVDEDIQKRKLEVMVQSAEKLWNSH